MDISHPGGHMSCGKDEHRENQRAGAQAGPGDSGHGVQRRYLDEDSHVGGRREYKNPRNDMSFPAGAQRRSR